jgi:hypothetical protein
MSADADLLVVWSGRHGLVAVAAGAGGSGHRQGWRSWASARSREAMAVRDYPAGSWPVTSGACSPEHPLMLGRHQPGSPPRRPSSSSSSSSRTGPDRRHESRRFGLKAPRLGAGRTRNRTAPSRTGDRCRRRGRGARGEVTFTSNHAMILVERYGRGDSLTDLDRH